MTQQYTAREMLERLVSFPTVSRDSNLPLIDFVADYLESHGVTSHRTFDETGTKASLHALIGPEVEGGVVLSGHTDVVPTDGQEWTCDPWTLTERDGKLFGRGTCDMKGFLATALAAVPQMVAADLAQPIMLALSYDEEVGCIGAPPMIDRMVAELPMPRACIVGEPSMMRLVDGHKGSVGLNIHVRGFEVHSSLVHTGVSAVMTASRLINWMYETMQENRANALPDTGFEPPWTTLHSGVIAGGTAHNITAKDCTFVIDIRVAPHESVDDWEKRFREKAAELEAEIQAIRPEAGIDIERRGRVPGLRPETDGAAATLVRQLTGDNSSGKVSYGTEGGQFQERGVSTVVCGPGSIEQAHQPDEFLSLDQLAEGERFIAKLIDSLRR
ncbi:acetylornithine deacetylase [Monaibacterium marinum]|uniref:Acetylornithine deacetylase n=1 Tax=Pontivivens marinum TaxID=1690039 RepID=A0A2C9CQC0_9RHOB|nr:acetylornithine deacetylase [Monaibacterium marinum]SOH93452.1 acetylornithine deacetylase [Monaibacterium marinum]